MRRSGPFQNMRFAAYRHFEKVPGQMTFRHHLLEFVICKPLSDTSLASLVRETHPEGADLACLSPSPSEGGIYSFRRSRRNSRKCDSFGRGRTGYCALYVFWMVFIAGYSFGRSRADAVKDHSFRRSAAEKDVPQRQQIVENGAVVERGMRGNAAQKACAEFAAVAVPGKDSRVSGTFLGGGTCRIFCVFCSCLRIRT